MRPQHPLHIPMACLATLALALTMSLSACGGEECVPAAGECPNICGTGIGVQGETCAATDDCSCGLFCSGESSTCEPYAGDNAGCSCVPLVGGGTDTGGDVTIPDVAVQEDVDDGPIDDCPKLTPVNSATTMAWICNPYCQTGCPDGMACTYSNGNGACAPAGTGDMGDVCTGTSCMAGHTCIQFQTDAQATCRRFCSDDSQCGDDRMCSLTVNGEFTVCTEPTVGCDLFGSPATACPDGQGCYYNNQTSQCMAAGDKQDGGAVMGACSGSALACMGDSQCTDCIGYVADANAADGTCLGTTKVCSSHEACQQCEGYSPESAEEILGTCSHDGATTCIEDLACVSECEGYQAAAEVTPGSCSNAPATECEDSAECGPTCDGFVAGTLEVKGTCFNDASVECSADADCEGSICTGNIPAGTDTPGACSSDGAVSCVADADCLAACVGVGDPVPEVKGTCSDDADLECSSDADCAAGVCVGNTPATTATTGACADNSETTCTTTADCVPTCGGFAAASEEVMGTCAGDDTPCQADDACSSTCEGYVAEGPEVMGTCSDGMESPTECMDDSACQQTCENLVEAVNETAGTCAYDDATECTAALLCDSSCVGYVPGDMGAICDGANDCIPGLQCLVVCTGICSLDGSVGLSCADCSVESMEINADNNMGICIDENIPAACDLYNQTGCASGEACYSLRGGHGCLEEGSQPEGTECKFSNECTAGNMCINSMCLEACDIGAAEGAPESCGVKCNGGEPGTLTPTIWNIGFCKDASPAEPCSFWEQNCDNGKVCYGTVLGEACMTPDGTATEGAGCSRNQDCAPGLVCPSTNSPTNANKCTRPCSTTIPDFEGSLTDCGSHADCALPESCIDDKCRVPECSEHCPASSAEPVTTDSTIGTCNQPL